MNSHSGRLGHPLGVVFRQHLIVGKCYIALGREDPEQRWRVGGGWPPQFGASGHVAGLTLAAKISRQNRRHHLSSFAQTGCTFPRGTGRKHLRSAVADRGAAQRRKAPAPSVALSRAVDGATELATALHHNAQRPRLVVEVPREGWRSSRTECHGTRSPNPQARDWLP